MHLYVPGRLRAAIRGVDGRHGRRERALPLVRVRERAVRVLEDAALDGQLETRFTSLQTLLDQQKSGDGFKSYDDVSKSDIKALSDAVNALAEPLSKLTAAVS